GITGSDQIGDYQFLDTYSIGAREYNGRISLVPTRLYNGDYSWEKNEKLEFSLDIGLIKDRILLSSSYYKNLSSSQLVGIPLPSTTGFSSLNSNLPATVENSGWEI